MQWKAMRLTNKNELDALAAKLMAEADKAAAKAENKGITVLDLLTDDAGRNGCGDRRCNGNLPCIGR